jgi:ABC-type multidrug transport system fused ATPase/permease subunit
LDIYEGLETEVYDRNYKDWVLLKRIFTYFKPYSRLMLFIAALIALDSITVAASPILIAKAVDIIAGNPDKSIIVIMVGIIVLLGIVGWVANYVRQRFAAIIVGNVVLKLREDAFSATISNDLSFYDEHSSGKIVSRVTSDTQDFSSVVTLIIDLLSHVLVSVILIVWLASINGWLTLILICMMPVATAIALSFRHFARKITQKARRIDANIHALIQESISGIMIAKIFRQEQSCYSDFKNCNNQSYQVELRRGLTFNTIYPFIAMASGIGAAILIYSGGIAVHNENISAGTWFLFMQSVAFFWYPLMNIASFWSLFQSGLSASERVFSLIDAEHRVKQNASEAVEKIDGRIEFKKVDFRYNNREKVLTGFDLDICQGETLALVGHTGAGKSSIAKLVLRFYEFQSGQILIDGQDIRSLDLEQYVRHIGIVPQDPFLFSGTVRDNIRYGQPWANDEDVLNAAKQISNGDWIADLPEGMDTDVGERGANLSMGQRQLIALSRVILKDPAILILDEATASIDPFTEFQIQEGLDKITEKRTSIIIAHRLSTIRNADRIIMLDHGRITEEGTHTALMAKKGQYAQLYDKYFRHQSMEYIESLKSIE